MRLLALDPGSRETAILVYDTEMGVPTHWALLSNSDVLVAIDGCGCDALAIEEIRSYGMAVGQETFDTCVWEGRFIERWLATGPLGVEPLMVPRMKVRQHLCDDSRAGDSNVRQALVDRFGGQDKAIGLKASPGPLYKLTGHCWSALGVAVTAIEHRDFRQLTLDALEQCA